MKNVVKRLSDGLDYISSGLRSVLGGSEDEVATERFALDGNWFASHMKEISWVELTGAEVATDDGNLVEVCGVQVRPWPEGPILEVKFISGAARGNAFYNRVGFTSGKFKKIYPHPSKVDTLKEIYNAAIRLDEIRQAQERLKNQLLEQQRKEEEIRVKEQTELRRKEVELLDASRKFDLVLFDLDDTLLPSGHLERFRGRNNLNNEDLNYISLLKLEASKLGYLITPDEIKSLVEMFPSLKIGVFTRAPKNYAKVLLSACYPEVSWDCLIAFEDVQGRTKPLPTGIFQAVEELKLEELSRVLVIGDQSSDLLAGYQAGATVVLFTKGWGGDWNSRDNPNRRENYFAKELMPDARVSRFSDILEIISKPERYYPALEAWCSIEVDERNFPLRIDTRNHFNNSLNQGAQASWVVTNALGRYFPTGGNHRYDFSRREENHETTKVILRAKDGFPYPDEWVECIKKYIEYVSGDLLLHGCDVVVTIIPSSGISVGANRLKEFIERVSLRINIERVVFDPEIIKFKPGVLSNKTLSQADRFINVENHMQICDAIDLDGKAVIVLDDVVTSGATLYYADRYLKAAGAYKVVCVALTQTIS